MIDIHLNSHFQLQEHIWKHFEVINKAIQKVDRSDSAIKNIEELLSLVVDAMQYFLKPFILFNTISNFELCDSSGGFS